MTTTQNATPMSEDRIGDELRVLVVDPRGDSIKNEILERLRTLYPGKTVTAESETSGSKALGMVNNTNYSLVITNLHLRSFISGNAVARAAKARGQSVISLTTAAAYAPVDTLVLPPLDGPRLLDDICETVRELFTVNNSKLLAQETR